ncbi:bifunctional 2-polyprenyl-6-hydroxyphenol methylase/3-demethylubiquinol 3-O-methyltransferase UbiG [Desulfovibrio sp. JC022]|uniref:class I SAM-dependent methyltransferase n=1 Tax=Desulfovibrio sp. JC022 TaxID=2593642 RepID=UPI0013D52154|nr:class I SAM-dependent methyltransferase [Desulfovibrio sp. JC022]NDV22202.1 class I SAM-dependent methyltransferase [Desulfovibrio sp. JC022]
MLQVPSDVIILLGPNESYIVYNVFSRTCLALDAEALNCFRKLEKDAQCNNESHGTVWEIGWFSNDDGLLADPTRIIREKENWPAPQKMSGEELKALFLKNSFLVEDLETYRERFSLKKGLLDFNHFGNFHQQLGQHLLTVKREDPVKWWYNQKFTEDLSQIKKNLYHSVQENYLKQYLPGILNSETSIVDLGCGVGYYSKHMASLGAQVLAVDPNTHYLELAADDLPENLKTMNAPIGQPNALDKIESNSVDYVFMSDALLFYFVPETPDQQGDISILMNDIHRILKPNGKFISVEPNSTFFLAPWFGDDQHPFTILSEYRNRNFNIVAPQSDMIKAILPFGFNVSMIDDMYSSSEIEDKRAHSFAKEFPVWQIIEFSKV